MAENKLRPVRDNMSKQDNSFLKIFNYAGSAFVFFGIAYFINANWFYLNNFAKIFATLGSALAAFAVAMMLHITHRFRTAASAFFMLAGFVLPIGLYVTFDVLNLSMDPPLFTCLISGICLAVFLVCFFLLPRTLFLLFTLIYASFFYLNVIDWLSYHSGIIFINLFEYEIVVLGISYILLGYYLQQEKHAILVGPLYFFGSFFVLSASYFLGSAFFFGNAIIYWKIISAVCIVLAFILSVPLRSKSLLYFGAIFLILYILDVSYKYAHLFGDIGWSLVLVLIGLLCMLTGYLIFYIRHKMHHEDTLD